MGTQIPNYSWVIALPMSKDDFVTSTHRIQVLNPPFKHTEIILHLSSFDPSVLVFVVHMVSTKNTQTLLRLSIILIALSAKLDVLDTYSEIWKSVLRSCTKGSQGSQVRQILCVTSKTAPQHYMIVCSCPKSTYGTNHRYNDDIWPTKSLHGLFFQHNMDQGNQISQTSLTRSCLAQLMKFMI